MCRSAGSPGCHGQDGASLKLEIDPDQVQYIPANIEAQIRATTVFGAKFVELVSPTNPSKRRLASGEVLQSSNVSTEVNTVFENLVDLVKMIDPAKLNAVLTALAEGVRGQGERIGQATTDANQVLTALNDRSETIRQDWRSFKNFNDTYAAAAHDILAVLDAASTTSATVVNHPDVPGQPAAQRHRLLQRRDQPARHQQGQSRRIGQRPRAHHEPAAQVQPRLHLLAAGPDEQPEERGLFGVWRRGWPQPSV